MLALADVKLSVTAHCKKILLLWQENKLQQSLQILGIRHQHLSRTQISKWSDARHQHILKAL